MKHVKVVLLLIWYKLVLLAEWYCAVKSSNCITMSKWSEQKKSSAGSIRFISSIIVSHHTGQKLMMIKIPMIAWWTCSRRCTMKVMMIWGGPLPRLGLSHVISRVLLDYLPWGFAIITKDISMKLFKYWSIWECITKTIHPCQYHVDVCTLYWWLSFLNKIILFKHVTVFVMTVREI